jgi:hypothetical protein
MQRVIKMPEGESECIVLAISLCVCVLYTHILCMQSVVETPEGESVIAECIM